MRVVMGVSPFGSCVEVKKLRDPQGISSSNVIVSIADHSHDHPRKSPSTFTVKYMEIKVMTQHFCLSTWSFRTCTSSAAQHIICASTVYVPRDGFP